MPRSILRIFAISAIAISFVSTALAEENEDIKGHDPYFREALFLSHQGLYFEALARLDAELAQHYGVDEPELDSLHPQIDDAEFSVGDFELQYRMHLRAGRAIRSVLQGDVDEKTRADAALRLARIHFQKGEADTALRVLDEIAVPVPAGIEEDVAFLRANVLMSLSRPADAAKVLRSLQDSKSLLGFSGYNLAIALLESGEPNEAAAVLLKTGKLATQNRAALAIRDKTNLILGSLLFDAEEFKSAQSSLERVRLSGPFSNQALLRSGWASSATEEFERAVVPWSLLADRDPTDASVQEALLALPYAYSQLDIHGRAAVLYERAVTTFGGELERLDASIDSIKRGDFLDALRREEIRQDKDWVVHLRKLPDAPETFYLLSLMASHGFQTGLQNYLDLEDMRRKLHEWRTTLSSLEELVRIRRTHYEPLIPEIDEAFRTLDAERRLRLEQRKYVDQRLNSLLTLPDPALLATRDEHQALVQIERLEAQLKENSGSIAEADVSRRLRLLKGLLLWSLDTRFQDRLTEAHTHLRELNNEIVSLSERYESFVRTRQAATHSFEGYQGPIKSLRERAENAALRVDELITYQGKALETVAIRTLSERRIRLEAYQNQARFAFADSYDRAAKARHR